MQIFHSVGKARLLARVSVHFSLGAIATGVAVCAQNAAAQEHHMPTTVVTAARSETKLDETLGEVRVITQQQIENSTGRSLAEVLQRYSDVRMASNGTRGNAQSVYIRGSNKIVVLIDGVRYGSATLGTATFEALPLEAIERIEVVHGPASALYGSDAIGGVIQIFTKQGKGINKPFAPHASVTWGTAGYKAAAAGFAGAQNGWNYSVDVARVLDPGFSSTNAKTSDFDPDRDPFSQSSVNAALGYRFAPDWHLGLNLMHSQGKAEYDQRYVYLPDGSSPLVRGSVNEVTAQLQQLTLKGKLTQDWQSTWSIGRSVDKQSASHTLIGRTDRYQDLFKTEQTEYKWNNEIKTTYGPVIVGVERLEQKVDSLEAYSNNKRHIDALYLGWNGAAGNHSWQVNARHDKNSQFGHANTWGVSYGYELLDGLRAHVARTRSMRAPTFNDLYYPYSGNAQLKPEHGLSNEIGLAWTQGDQSIKLVRFDNKVTDLINWAAVDPSDPYSLWAPANIDRASLKGWSLSANGKWQSWTGSANFQYLDAFNDKTGVRMTDRLAKQQLTLNLERQQGAWTAGGSALYVGKRTDQSGRQDLPSYTTLDVYAQRKLTADWSVQLRVANLTDKAYETAYGYQQKGRSAYVTLKWAPK